MQRGISLKLLLILAALGSGVAQAGTGSISASVITPLTLSESSTLEFGQLQSTDTSGTVVIDESDRRTASGGAIPEGGSVQSGTWSVSGEPSTAYTIALPGSDVVLSSGADSMSVNNFTDSAAGTSSTDAAGNDSFKVGATLNVDANQPDGAYSGSYEVTIAYQ